MFLGALDIGETEEASALVIYWPLIILLGVYKGIVYVYRAFGTAVEHLRDFI